MAPLFKASPKLQNLLLTDDIVSLAPVTDMIVDDIDGGESKQIYTLCGRGHRSSLRVLKHGVSISEMAVSELPGRPTGVWTVKKVRSTFISFRYFRGKSDLFFDFYIHNCVFFI